MIRKLKLEEYRIYSRKKDQKTNKRKILALCINGRSKKHEREIQAFKHK